MPENNKTDKKPVRYQTVRKPIVLITAGLFHVFLVFHLLFSPVIIVSASHNGIINASFVAFALMFLMSMFFGRAYCSWFCPGCGVQEILNWMVKRKSPNNRALFIKYLIFIIWAGAILTGYLIMGLQQIDLTYGMAGITLERKIILTAGAAMIIVPLTLIFGRFASCKYVCWQAPILITGKKIRDYFRWPGLRLVADPAKCKNCDDCTDNCPMNIDVRNQVKKGDMDHLECILCGNCIDQCNQKAIRFSFKI